MSDQIVLIKGDGRYRESKLWHEWLNQVPVIRNKSLKWSQAAGVDDYDPFYFNEAASVALLSNAAALAGFLVQTEYCAIKREPGRGRRYRNGRVDMWLADVASGASWALEAKQHWALKGMRSTTYDGWMDKAAKDAKALHEYEAGKGVGCVIIVPKQPLSPAPDEETVFDTYCKDADFSYRIGGGLGAVWIAFCIR